MSAEDDVWSDDLQKGWADPWHPIQPRQIAKGAVGRTIGYDGFGEPEADFRKPGHFRGAGRFDVDLFFIGQRPRLPHGAVSLGPGRPGRQNGEQLYLSRWLTWTSEQIPHSVTGNTKSEQEQQRPAFCGWHARR